MVREIVDVAIKQRKPMEITYSKDGVSTKVFNLIDVTYSQQYGNNYICGYCEKYKSELTFSIDKITHANVDWIEILEKKHVQNKMVYMFLFAEVTCTWSLN